MLFRACRVGSRFCRGALRPLLQQSFTCSSHNLSGVGQVEEVQASTSLTKLPHRSLINVRGSDGVNLLQGLVTADVLELSQRQSMYSMLLNAQGRVLYDVILYHRGDGHLIIECDAKIVGDIIKHLKKYALRSDVAIESEESCAVWASYPGSPQQPLSNVIQSHPDPRVRSLGSRILAPITSSGSDISGSLQISSRVDYHRHRLKMGVAEGVAEMPVGACFPLEYNADYLNGVSFSKGCYLGQELTARTHHTGVIRKRVVPVTFQERDGLEVNGGAKIVSSSGKNVGKLISHLGGIGVALLRVQEMNGPLSLASEGGQERVSLSAHTPGWWPSVDEAS